jgi:DNA repair protein RecO (recombination protein O)
MALGRSSAVVIGSLPLGESDRIVTFFSRQFGKIRGVARAARRMRSRFAGSLELLTLGDLVFFDTGRGELVQVDHFDVARPFAAVRADLERLGQAAWMVECVGRLTADRDPNPALFGLLVRGLASLEAGAPPRRVAIAFGFRCIEALGHRLRSDRCLRCGRREGDGRPAAVDVEAGGLLCHACAAATPAAVPVHAPTVLALRRERALGWAEATTTRLGRAERELRLVLDCHVAHLMGQPPRTLRFVRDVERLSGDRR